MLCSLTQTIFGLESSAIWGVTKTHLKCDLVVSTGCTFSRTSHMRKWVLTSMESVSTKLRLILEQCSFVSAGDGQKPWWGIENGKCCLSTVITQLPVSCYRKPTQSDWSLVKVSYINRVQETLTFVLLGNNIHIDLWGKRNLVALKTGSIRVFFLFFYF